MVAATLSSGVRVGWLESESGSGRQVYSQVMSPDTAMIVTLVGGLYIRGLLAVGVWIWGPPAPLGEFSFVFPLSCQDSDGRYICARWR